MSLIDLESALASFRALLQNDIQQIFDAASLNLEVDVKTVDGVSSIVSNVDLQISKLLFEFIDREFPSVGILSEEQKVPYDPAQKEKYLKDSYFVIDELDGTDNFVKGLPFYATSIAYIEHGLPQLACVYRPGKTGDMLPRLYTAIKGKGVMLNGKPMQQQKQSRKLIAHDWSYDPALAEKAMAELPKWFTVGRVRNLGSCVMALAYVAEGVLNQYEYGDIKPWDQAAAALLIEESGGKVRTQDGQDWTVFSKSIKALRS